MIGKLFKKKKPELSESEREWKAAFETVLRELVPGEPFELVAVREPSGATRFELVTESKRAMVAWAEIQEVLQPVVNPMKSTT